MFTDSCYTRSIHFSCYTRQGSSQDYYGRGVSSQSLQDPFAVRLSVILANLSHTKFRSIIIMFKTRYCT